MYTGFVLLLLVTGLVLAVRGYFGSSAAARRWTVVVLLVTVLAGLLATAARWIWAQELVTRLGPAATPTDVARAHQAALTPFGVALAGALAVAVVAAIGWALSPDRAAATTDPRRPAR